MITNFAPNTDKMKSNNRVLKLSPREGVSMKDAGGLVDNRLFKGENSLHVIMDPQLSLWSFKYEKGDVPPALKSRFTTFQAAYKEAVAYFNKRNIEITEVVD